MDFVKESNKKVNLFESQREFSNNLTFPIDTIETLVVNRITTIIKFVDIIIILTFKASLNLFTFYLHQFDLLLNLMDFLFYKFLKGLLLIMIKGKYLFHLNLHSLPQTEYHLINLFSLKLLN